MTTKIYKAKLFDKFSGKELAEIAFYCAFTAQFDIRHEKYKNFFIVEKGNETFYKEIREYKNSHIDTYNNNKKQISVKNIADFERFLDKYFNSSIYHCKQIEDIKKLIANLLNESNINVLFMNEYYYNGLELKKQMLSEKTTRELAEKAHQTEREKQLNPLLDNVRKIKESVIDSFNEFLDSVECLRDNENANYISVRNEYYRKLEFLENINNQLCENFY